MKLNLRIFLLFVVAAQLKPTWGKIYDRCSLAQALNGLGVPRDQLPTWDCIALHESSYNTDAVGNPNSDGSRDFGIFQINNYYWCQDDNGAPSSNSCHIRCQDFLVDSVEPNLRCAQQVLSETGWSAWTTYKYCQGNLPGVDDCF